MDAPTQQHTQQPQTELPSRQLSILTYLIIYHKNGCVERAMETVAVVAGSQDREDTTLCSSPQLQLYVYNREIYSAHFMILLINGLSGQENISCRHAPGGNFS